MHLKFTLLLFLITVVPLSTGINAKVSEVKELSDGTLAFDDECTDGSDQGTGKKTSNQAAKQDNVKKTIVKSSSAQPQQKATSKQNNPVQITQKTNLNTQEHRTAAPSKKAATQPPKPDTQSPKPVTQPPKASVQPVQHATQSHKAATYDGKIVPRVTKKSGRRFKQSKPSNIDCDNDHKITAQDDGTVLGALTVRKCRASRFVRRPSRSHNVGNQLNSLLHTRLQNHGVKDQFHIKIVKTVGDTKQTEFHYTLTCDKSRQKTVIDSLKDACKDSLLKDTVTNEKQPDEDDSSSESSEESRKPIPSTPKPTITTKSKTVQHKVTKADAKRRTPATKRTVNIKNCDDDDIIHTKDDDTLVGKIVIHNCGCQRRFQNNATRLAAVSKTVTTQLQHYFQKLYKTKVDYPITVKVLTGNKTHTVFNYVVKVPKANHGQAKVAMQHACKDEEVKKTIEKESIKRDDDDDSDSSSSESGEKSIKPTSPKTKPTVTTEAKTVRHKAPRANQKRRIPATKRTVNIKNCDDDDNIHTKDDDTLVGKIVIHNCGCQRRFQNNATRLAAVSKTVTTQLQHYFQKLYKTKVDYPITVKVLTGNKTHTVFNYVVKVPKTNHGQAKVAMQHACKDEEVKKTIEKESIKRDDDDDSDSSSSESGEKSTKSIPSTPKPTMTTKSKTVRHKVTKADAKRRTPATKRAVNIKNCDDDDSIHAKDDDTLVGKIVIHNCGCQRRFQNNATRLAAVSKTVTIQLQHYFQKLYKTKVDYPITVKVLTGNKTHTVFNYVVKVPKANHGQAKVAMQHACKDEEVKKTIEKESIKRDDDDDSDSSSSESGEKSTLKRVTTEVTQKNVVSTIVRNVEQSIATSAVPKRSTRTASISTKMAKSSNDSSDSSDHSRKSSHKPHPSEQTRTTSARKTTKIQSNLTAASKPTAVKSESEKPQPTTASQATKEPRATTETQENKEPKPSGATLRTKGPKPSVATKATEEPELLPRTQGTREPKVTVAANVTKAPKLEDETEATKGPKLPPRTPGTKGPKPTVAANGTEAPKREGETRATKLPKLPPRTQETKGPKPTVPANGTKAPKLEDETHATKGPKLPPRTQGTKEPKPTVAANDTAAPKLEFETDATKGPKLPSQTQETKEPKPTVAANGTKAPKVEDETDVTKEPKLPPQTQETKGPKPTLAANGIKAPKVEDETEVTKETKLPPRTQGTKEPKPTVSTNGTEAPKREGETDATKEPKLPPQTQETKEPKPTVAANGTKAPKLEDETDATKGPELPSQTQETKGPKPTLAANGIKAPKVEDETDVTKEPKLPPQTQETKGPKPTLAANGIKAPKVEDETEVTKETKLRPRTQGTKDPKPTVAANATKAPKLEDETDATREPKLPPQTQETKEPKPTVAADGTKAPKVEDETDVTKETKLPPQTQETKGPKPSKGRKDSSESSNDGLRKSSKPHLSRRTKPDKPSRFTKDSKTSKSSSVTKSYKPQFNGSAVSARTMKRTVATKAPHHPTNGHKKTKRPIESSSSESDDRSSQSMRKQQSDHVTRTLKTTDSVPVIKGRLDGEDCPRCAFRKISSSLLLEGTSIKRVATTLCGRFPQHFKHVLAAEIRKHQRIGLKAIEITNITIDKKQNLFIEFDIFVSPRYNTLIRNALRRAVITLDLNRILKYQQ